jgi:hypothetical protein
MIDIPKLIDAADKPGSWPVGLSAFCDELAAQLLIKAAERTAKNSRGHKSYSEHIGTAVVELTAVATALRRHQAAPDPDVPITCTSVNQDDATCVRTDAGHQAHTYPPAGTFVCGIQDRYAGETPDRCTRPPHGRDIGHEGAYSKWPWQDEPPASSESSDSQAILAFLKGDTDELALTASPRTDTDEMGTEAMVFPVEPPIKLNSGATDGSSPALIPEGRSGYIEVGISDPVVIPGPIQGHPFTNSKPLSQVWAAASGDPMTPGMPDPCQPIGCDNGYHLPGCEMQPDPFDNALPEEVRRTATWRPEPDPRPLWLPAPGYSTDRGSAIPAPTSIRTTHVRVGEECGMAYRLLSRDGVPEVPAWWNVGGNTLHECARYIEMRIIEGMNPYIVTEEACREIWNDQFVAEIAVLEAETPFPMHQWRAANKGAEGLDWWNEVGPLMVRDYSAASAQWHADGWDILIVQDKPAMELEMRAPIMGMTPGGELTGHLDQAWYRLDEGDEWEIRIRDLKTGRELPTDEWQLEAYALLLRSLLANNGRPLVGGLDRCLFSAVYYDARNGKDGEVKDLTAQNVAEIHYRAGSVLSMHANNSYPANPGSDWKAPCYLCSVRYACPIMALKS